MNFYLLLKGRCCGSVVRALAADGEASGFRTACVWKFSKTRSAPWQGMSTRLSSELGKVVAVRRYGSTPQLYCWEYKVDL